ncbi:hypothetical protein M0R04_10775 [Candidatus Dojkabacteria bacterium]|jgi:hypothetical protein|nr:hypothetical protein [Candidatus Dojkabacteria bacterium]
MTCEKYILEQLENRPNGLAGGTLEDNVRDLAGYKSSTVSRIARSMAEDRKIQRGEFLVNGKKCVFYRHLKFK